MLESLNKGRAFEHVNSRDGLPSPSDSKRFPSADRKSFLLRARNPMFRPIHRYNKLYGLAKRFARVPRYGRLVSRLSDLELDSLHTEADLFWYAYSYVERDDSPASQTGIIDDALRGSATKQFGWHDSNATVDLSEPFYRAWQIRLAMAMLGAVAFEIMFGEGTTMPSGEIRDSVRYRGGQWIKNVLTKRVIESGAYCDVMDQTMLPQTLPVRKRHREHFEL
jgi:hypothetical protein